MSGEFAGHMLQLANDNAELRKQVAQLRVERDEAKAERTEMSKAADDVLAERVRQIGAEGWSADHDDSHEMGALAAAAGCYAIHWGTVGYPEGKPPPDWPWDPAWWKPKEFRRDMVRAAALLIAEIERFDRGSC